MVILLILSIFLITIGIIICFKNQYKLAYFIFKVRIYNKDLDKYGDREKEEFASVVGLHTIVIGVIVGLAYLFSTCIDCYYIMALLIPILILIHIKDKVNIRRILKDIKNGN